MRTLDGGDIGIHKHMVVVDERGNWYAMTGGEEMHGWKRSRTGGEQDERTVNSRRKHLH